MHAFSRKIDLSPKSRRQDQKSKKFSANFPFLSFRLWPPYPTGIKVGSKWPWQVFKHAEMQAGTRGVQSFSAKCGEASVPPAQQFKTQIETPDCLFFERVINHLLDLSSLGIQFQVFGFRNQHVFFRESKVSDATICNCKKRQI